MHLREETFAPTANLTSVRALLQIAAQHDLILHQMDVICTLNGLGVKWLYYLFGSTT